MRRRFFYLAVSSDLIGIPNNEIWYTSVDNNLVDPVDVFNTTIISNTYSNGKGIIIFDDSVVSIGEEAFAYCDGLTSVTIPNSVKSIEFAAFDSCSALTSVTIGNSVTSIGDGAFYGCSSLTSVTIPDGVTSIGSSAFEDCSGLTSVTIGNSVESIGDHAFYGCFDLTSVHIFDIATWCNIDFNDFSPASNPLEFAHHLYLNGEEVKDLVIPNSVKSIGNCAFVGGSGLTSVTIPNSVTSIGQEAFLGCSGLTSITCEAIIPPTITSSTFSGVSTSIPVYVPAESVDAYKSAQYWSNFTNIQAIS